MQYYKQIKQRKELERSRKAEETKRGLTSLLIIALCFVISILLMAGENL